jgi:NAD(P)-dependent dehydrogenase (short-subunit alcohol dehydrogenase family)
MPGGRAATVKEVAETVAFLASDRSSFTSGGSVIIDGGLMAGTLR